MTIKADAAIGRYNMLEQGNTVIVGLSGGADSMALFHFLWQNRQRYGIAVRAAHLNHGLRGAEADRDEAVVRQMCAAYGAPLDVENAHMLEREKPVGKGTEEWARTLRYSFFEALATRWQAKVATAHTLSDSAETMLFNLARGAGVRGMSGIPPVRGPYIRPLITTTRQEVEAYCQENRLPFVTDSTNLSDAYSRNRIRHRVVPQLEQINPAFLRSAGEMAEDMAALDAYLDQQGQALLAHAGSGQGYNAAALLAAPQPVRRRALALLLSPLGLAGRDKLLLCEQTLASGGRVQLAPELFFQCRGQEAGLWRPTSPAPAYQHPFSPGVHPLPGGYVLSCQLLSYEEFVKICETEKNILKNAADYDRIKNTLIIRNRRQGDFYRPAGRGVGKSLKKYMIEQKIPAQARSFLPLLCCGQQVVYCWGEGMCDGVTPGPGTRTVLVAGPANAQ